MPSHIKKRGLRILNTLSFVVSCIQFISLTVSYFTIDINLSNPLIPRYLIDYVRFPTYLLAPIFLVLGVLSYRNIKYEKYKEYEIIMVFSILMVYYLFRGNIHELINTFNPHGI